MESCCLSEVGLSSTRSLTTFLTTQSSSGILVPGGFGMRGTEGMMLAIKWAREKHIPFLGICLGFQLAVVEFARNVCGFAGVYSLLLSLPPICGC